MDWMNQGQSFIRGIGGQGAVLNEIARLTWHNLCKGQSAPMSQGIALNTLLQEVVKGRATQIAFDGVLKDRYALLGIEATYKNGTYRHYWADVGTELIPLVTIEVNP